MKSDIEIIQAAMIHAGLIPIQSLDDGTPLADSAKILWPGERKVYLAHIAWRFANRFVQLTRDDAVPVAQWDYQFGLPIDRVLPPYAFYSGPDTNLPAYQNFEIVADKVMTDIDALWAAFTADVQTTLWPPYFTVFAEHAFAAIIARAAQLPDSVIQREQVTAWGNPSEQGRGGLAGVARVADGRFNRTRTLIRDGGPLMTARRGG